MPEMTKQQFEKIAETIKDSSDEDLTFGGEPAGTRKRVYKIFCEKFADSLKTTNPNFDRGKFLKACKLRDF